MVVKKLLNVKTTNTPNNIMSVIISIRVSIMNIRRKCSKRDHLNKNCFYNNYINVVSIMSSYILFTNFVSGLSYFKFLTIHYLIASIKSYHPFFRENNALIIYHAFENEKWNQKYHKIFIAAL